MGGLPEDLASQQPQGKQVAASYMLEIEGPITYAIGTKRCRPLMGRSRPIVYDLDVGTGQDDSARKIRSICQIEVLR